MEPSNSLLKANKEILKVLEKYPELAYHVLLVEKEGDTCVNLMEGSQEDIFRGIYHTAMKVDLYREVLEVAVRKLSMAERPTEEDLADTLIDSWLKLHPEGKDDATEG